MVATLAIIAQLTSPSALSFWMSAEGAVDMALGWQDLTASERTTYLQEYNAAGISLIVSAFGSSDTPTTSGTNPVTVANNLASWILEYGLQGVDIDYEVLVPFALGKMKED